MDRNKIAIIFILLFAIQSNAGLFKFYVKNEPHSLSPTHATSGESNYITTTLFRGLTRYDSDGQVIFDQAERCRYIIDTDVRCKLRKDLKYSDGSSLTAQDFVNSFLKILSSGASPFTASMLFSIKNARSFYLGKSKVSDVGIKALNKREIQFILEEPDWEFLDTLSHPLLVPYIDDTKFNGPYLISEKIKNKKWILKPNLKYHGGNTKRPDIEIVFVSDDSTAVNLYEKGDIDFLWRVPIDRMDQFKKKKDYFEVPLSRFDYIGFNQRKGKPLNDLSLRKLLSTHVDFLEFQKMHKSLTPGGCIGLGNNYIFDIDNTCQVFNPKKEKHKEKLSFYFSKLGGDDIQKQAEWFQDQWKNNLDLSVNLKPTEHKMLVRLLKNDPPDIFRKGVALLRPSCLAGLEQFKSDYPENYTGFDDKKFDEMIAPLKLRKLSRYEKSVICESAIKYLFKEKFVGIPLGHISFPMMLNPKFKNLKINDLNQLNLSELSDE